MLTTHARPRPIRAALAVAATLAIASTSHAANDVAGSLITFKRNGGWSWFSTASHVIDGDQLLIGSVAGTTNSFGTGGDIQVTGYNISTGISTSSILSAALQRDDHNNPSFIKRADGRWLTIYQRHGNDDLLRRRISTSPGSVASWGSEATTDVNPDNNFGNTYTNPFYLPAENRIYNFSRSVGYDPNYSYSDDGGQAFTYGDRYIIWNNPNNNNASGGRPYVKYASNKLDTIYLTTSTDHPRDFGNSIYAGFIRGGQVHNSSGTVVGPLFTPGVTTIGPQSLTRVFAGDNSNRAWTTDIELDPTTGHPHMAFSVREIRGSVTTLRHYYAKWNGSSWTTNPLAYAGNFLYAAENDYTGLVALDPNDANTLFLSTDVDPATGAPVGTGKHEIYRGTTADGGATWAWDAITSNSTVDNIRPMVPEWDGTRRAIMWMRGTYTTYANYDTDIVGLIQAIPEPTSLAMLLGASTTTLARRRGVATRQR